CLADWRVDSEYCFVRGFARLIGDIPAPRPRDKCGVPFRSRWHRTPPSDDPGQHESLDRAGPNTDHAVADSSRDSRIGLKNLFKAQASSYKLFFRGSSPALRYSSPTGSIVGF